MGFTPTRRELLLVIVLLLVLLSFARFYSGYTGWHFQPLSGSYANGKPSLDRHQPFPPRPRNLRNRLFFPSVPVPETRVLAHVPGWTIFDNMYILNGTVFLVSDHPNTLPSRDRMTSTSAPIENGLAAEMSRRPTDKEMRVVGSVEAKQLFGNGADIIPGVTFLVNDAPQYITHYYHWSAELWFGFWRTYASLDPLISSLGNTSLPQPRRMLFTHLDADHWRDYASMNEWVVRSSFPSLSAEYSHDWNDRARMGRPFVLDRVVFADRSAAMHGYNYLRTQRTASEPFALPGSANWWSTVRNNVIEFSGLDGSLGKGTLHMPVITYISRQDWGRRMLIQQDHEALIQELYKLRDTYGYEVNVVSMDKLTRTEQLHLAARTTIMMGVHGNGLTSLIWMKPSPRSTVIEFFYPGGFAHDYEWTTRALGMMHYAFWNTSFFTSPDVPLPAYPEGFQGNAIPIDGRAVAKLCEHRLALSEEADD